MTKEALYSLIHHNNLAVIATNNPDNSPEAALMGIVITEQLEIIFDTLSTSRKYSNLSANPSAAAVIGWDNMTSVQYEGNATELTGPEAEPYKQLYFAAFPDGCERAKNWQTLVYFKITPKWIRYCNFNEPKVVEELRFPNL